MNYENGNRTLTSKLKKFKIRNLITLLDAFGQNREGLKDELRKRALQLLRNEPQPGFDYQAYCSKITEIYNSMNDEISPDDQITEREMMNQQWMIIPHQYPQQDLAQAILPQVIPQIPSRMDGNNMGHQYEAPNYFRNISPQFIIDQQIAYITPNPIAYAGINNLPSFNRISFRKLPFFEVLDEIIRPTLLNAQNRCTNANNQTDMKEKTFEFQLTCKHATDLGLYRDISYGKCHYPFQMQIRIGHLDSGSTEIIDCLTTNIVIRVNGKVIRLPLSVNAKSKVQTKSPINISDHLKFNPICPNTVTVYWISDDRSYIFGLYLVEVLTADFLIKKLQEKEGRSSEETKNYIIKKLANDDPDLATISYRVSLVCPLGKMRMKIPAKSINCDHMLQCFDASTFILMNEKKPTWICPTCNKNCFYDDIQIESYFMDIVSSPALADFCKEIEVLADGTWRMYEEKTDASNIEKTLDSVDLTDNNETTSSLKSSFIDLTYSDENNDEELPKATDFQTTMDLKPQAQVQPLEQDDVIVIMDDSPITSPFSPDPPLP